MVIHDNELKPFVNSLFIFVIKQIPYLIIRNPSTYCFWNHYHRYHWKFSQQKKGKARGELILSNLNFATPMNIEPQTTAVELFTKFFGRISKKKHKYIMKELMYNTCKLNLSNINIDE